MSPSLTSDRRITSLCHDSKLLVMLVDGKLWNLSLEIIGGPKMSKYIGEVSPHLVTCVFGPKAPSCSAPVGELTTTYPRRALDTISVDFIVELPESEGKDSVMVVVDTVTKRGHFCRHCHHRPAIGSCQTIP